ncbi:MAG TPA: hypothetical protein VMT91_02625 [Anaerolineales bacterium]|nr:hypothetical protein [Anaerolineales bacterium]
MVWWQGGCSNRAVADDYKGWNKRTGECQALDKLLANLAQVWMPPALLSQYAPMVFEEIREGQAKNRSSSVIEWILKGRWERTGRQG